MKRFYKHALVIFCIVCTNSCKKDSNTTDTPGLPPATQTGANTFGCLVNGVPWVPQGFGGTNNLSIDYDPRFSNGIFGIAAYNIIGNNNSSSIGLGIDSLNFIIAPKQINLNRNTCIINYTDNMNCFRSTMRINTNFVGSIEILKYDKQARIIAGNFHASLFSIDCGDTIKITKGRFDFKF